MRFSVAQAPSPDQSQDRVFLAGDAVVVLDGASSFGPARVGGDVYADVLGRAIANRLAKRRDARLVDVVAESIADTASALALERENSPSSTVAVLRQRGGSIDLYALGDGAIYFGLGSNISELVDSRLEEIDILERSQYRERLANGCGFDCRHRELLRRLQDRQKEYRNRAGGYWIAEADPEAAHHGKSRKLAVEDVSWVVLATDGAYEPLRFLGLDDWPWISQRSDSELADVLGECRRWEHEADADGVKFPRAKLSDDKTLVAARLE